MINKIILTALVSSTFIFVGCGGSDSIASNPQPIDPMTERDGIQILLNTPAYDCNQADLGFIAQSAVEDLILIRSEPKAVSCATYGRAEGSSCASISMYDLGSNIETDSSCILGWDLKE